MARRLVYVIATILALGLAAAIAMLMGLFGDARSEPAPGLRILGARIVQPDQVHQMLPERPPAEPWVRPPDAEGMVRVVAMLGSSAHVVHALPVDVNASDYATPAEAMVTGYSDILVLRI